MTNKQAEQHVTQLKDGIEETLAESGVYELISEFEDLKSRVEEFDEVKSAGRDQVADKLVELHEEDEVIESVRIRDGDAFRNNSPSKASETEVLDAAKNSPHFNEKDVEAAQKAISMSNDQLRKVIENQTRVLMDDDRAFDAVTLKVYRGGLKLKLIRLDGGKNDKMQPLEDIEDKHVEELIKFIRYREEKVEAIQEIADRVENS